ncbi:hypothetical protein EVAR_80556_1 [Eumeta japonica]|uniref:Uncharacterized protein n=1 Tax=Eumeta variegata TaxID=151549 RepID=A0A4C1TLJ9_EUMVA|nr:hypothetical protein EVAR_80556_1 [Eumeta japonica]
MYSFTFDTDRATCQFQSRSRINLGSSTIPDFKPGHLFTLVMISHSITAPAPALDSSIQVLVPLSILISLYAHGVDQCEAGENAVIIIKYGREALPGRRLYPKLKACLTDDGEFKSIRVSNRRFFAGNRYEVSLSILIYSQDRIFDGKRACESRENNVVTVTHGQSQPQRSHDYVVRLLGKNRISDESGNGVMEAGVRDGEGVRNEGSKALHPQHE